MTVKCEVCGNLYKLLTTHLRKHNISISKYKMDYPNAPLLSEEVQQKMSAKATARNNQPEIKAAASLRLAEANRKRWTDPIYREKMRVIRAEANKRNWKKTDYRAARIAEISAASKNPTEKQRAARRANVKVADSYLTTEGRSKRMKNTWREQHAHMVKQISSNSLYLWRSQTDKMLQAVKHNKFGKITTHVSPKAGVLVLRSMTEAAYARELDADDNVASYSYETTKIPYLYNDDTHTYTIDFTIVNTDGSTGYTEVKPLQYEPSPKDVIKWEAAKQQLPSFTLVERQG